MLTAQSRPPCAATIVRQIARPRPSPCCLDVKKGSTTAHVKIELRGGLVGDELRLTVGDDAYAVIKASDVRPGGSGLRKIPHGS